MINESNKEKGEIISVKLKIMTMLDYFMALIKLLRYFD